MGSLMQQVNAVVSEKKCRPVSPVVWLHPVCLESDNGFTCLGHSLKIASKTIAIRVPGKYKKGQHLKVFLLINSVWHCLPGKVTVLKKKTDDQNLLQDIGIEIMDSDAFLKVFPGSVI